MTQGQKSKQQIKQKGGSHEDQDKREGWIETDPSHLRNANKRNQQRLTS
jgi:hypothetical protein